MQYHRGLLHQRGHGWGALAKIAARAVAPVVGQLVGGLLGGVQGGAQTQTQTGHGAMDNFLNTALVAGHLFRDKKVLTGYFDNGKFVQNKKSTVWSQTERQRIIHASIENGSQTSLESSCSDGIRCIR